MELYVLKWLTICNTENINFSDFMFSDVLYDFDYIRKIYIFDLQYLRRIMIKHDFATTKLSVKWHTETKAPLQRISYENSPW